jgi:hypothetical protein
MFGSGVKSDIVVCGRAAASRLTGSVLPKLPRRVRVIEAHWRDRLLRELARRKPPLCVMEEYVPLRDEMPELVQLFGPNARAFAAAHVHCVVDMMVAHRLLPDLAECSPETKFVIACHMRSGVSREDRAAYEQRPEVLKVIGFINSERNTKLLVKTITRMYFEESP